MGDAAALRALADRVEKAEGPDRGLDLYIAAETEIVSLPDDDWCPPRFTRLLDAAVGLVPEGLSFGFTAPYRRDVVVSVFVPKSEKSEAQVWVPLEQTVGRAAAATPALALTAASLRARAAMMEGGDAG